MIKTQKAISGAIKNEGNKEQNDTNLVLSRKVGKTFTEKKNTEKPSNLMTSIVL